MNKIYDEFKIYDEAYDEWLIRFPEEYAIVIGRSKVRSVLNYENKLVDNEQFETEIEPKLDLIKDELIELYLKRHESLEL